TATPHDSDAVQGTDTLQGTAAYQGTARLGTITPRILNFEDEAGPSSPLCPIQVMESDEQLKAAEVLVSISRPRGLSIPGPIQTHDICLIVY
ncbi:hypothetical protein Tco_0463939, partial [Tanacetum coccineum]